MRLLTGRVIALVCRRAASSEQRDGWIGWSEVCFTDRFGEDVLSVHIERMLDGEFGSPSGSSVDVLRDVSG